MLRSCVVVVFIMTCYVGMILIGNYLRHLRELREAGLREARFISNPPLTVTLDDVALVEECYYEPESWKINDAHACRSIVKDTVVNPRMDQSARRKLDHLRAIYLSYVNGVPKDEQLMRDCYYRLDANYTACRQELSVHVGHFFTYGTQRWWNLSVVWQQLYEDDHNLVWHCFVYHHSMSAKRSTGSFCENIHLAGHEEELKRWVDYRQNNGSYPGDGRRRILANAWSQVDFQMSKLIQKTKAKDEERGQVLECMYSAKWLNDSQHLCWSVMQVHPLKTANMSEEAKAKLGKLQSLFLEIVFEVRLKDCFMYHTADQYDHCYGITWNEDCASNCTIAAPTVVQQIQWDEIKAQVAKEGAGFRYYF